MNTNLSLLALRTAVPYIRAYKGRTFVIKLGGGLCEPGQALENLVDQIAVLHQLGIKVVLVHGGGEQATTLAGRLGLQPRMVDGRRITDRDMLEVAKMAFAGVVNTNLLAALRRANVRAVGLSGVDAALVTVRRRPIQAMTDPQTGQVRDVDFGFVGDVQSVDAATVQHLLAGDCVPIICSLAADDAGQVYNVNADTIAASLAVGLQAAKYFAVTTVDGVLGDVKNPHTLHSYLDLDEVESLIRSGAVNGGMLPKLSACLAAVRGGVPRVHVVNGAVRDAILCEVFTNEGCGTLIVDRRDRDRPIGAEVARA